MKMLVEVEFNAASGYVLNALQQQLDAALHTVLAKAPAPAAAAITTSRVVATDAEYLEAAYRKFEDLDVEISDKTLITRMPDGTAYIKAEVVVYPHEV